MASESPANDAEPRPPRVFLSYSHDSPEHSARVLALALQLRRDGVDARIDQFDAFPPEGWPQWCARQILDARYVMIICTETYRRRFLGYEPAGPGRGVKWEGNVVQNILYNKEHNMRFIPVIFAPEDEPFIPEPLQGATRMLLGDCGASDAGYRTLVRHFTGGRTLPPFREISPAPGAVRPDDTSILTQDVWDEAERIFIELATQGRKASARHRVVMAGIVGLAVTVLGGGVWIAHSHREGVAKVEAIVVDPVVLRAKLEEKIDQTFEQKKGKLLAAKTSSAEIDALYRWRDRAKGQVAEGVAFITTRAADPKSPIIKKAAAILDERGVDAALEFLDSTLEAERQRRKEEGRQFAEASLMKAGLHESRLEPEEQERAIRDAIADAPDWWQPHNRLGMILSLRAQWQPAEQEYEAARKFVSADREGAVLDNLAQLYQATNRLAEAEPLMERALEIDEKSLGPEHPDVVFHLNNLGQLYQAANRLAEAEPLLERALRIDEKRLGPEHPDVARDLNNLALLYQATNRLAEAEPLMERALKIDEKNLGPEHRNVAKRLNNLATLYQATNRLEEAESLMERALKLDERNYGLEHPDVARDLNNLAQLYQYTNRLVEAEPLMERALQIDQKSYGPEHPAVARDLNNLALLYEATNRLAEAEPLLKRALEIDEKSFESEHPEVATNLNNLGQLYQATNRLAEAEPLLERALEINEKSFGAEHPEVATNLNNLAQLYQATDRLAEAEPLLERALKINEKSFGPEHPSVATSLAGLADLYQDTKRLAGAEPLMERALKINEKSFGQEHPEVAKSLNNLARLYEDTNRLAEAEPLEARCLVIFFKFTRKTGHLHPNLRKGLGNYKRLLGKMSLPESEIAQRLAAAGRDAGYTPEEFAALLQRLSE